MVLFNSIPYKRMCLTSKVNLTKCFSEKYKHMHLITILYGSKVLKVFSISKSCRYAYRNMHLAIMCMYVIFAYRPRSTYVLLTLSI